MRTNAEIPNGIAIESQRVFENISSGSIFLYMGIDMREQFAAQTMLLQLTQLYSTPLMRLEHQGNVL